MLKTLLGQKKYEEEMLHEQPLNFTELKNHDFKKIGKLQEKTIRIINIHPLKAPVENQKYQVNILKLKDFVMLRNTLFVKGCLNQNAPGSFNDKFSSSKLPLNHTARSSSIYQVKVIGFKLFTLVLQFTVMKYTLTHSFIHLFIQ